MNGASLLTSKADGVVSSTLGRAREHTTHHLTVGAVRGVAARPATARQQPLSIRMMRGCNTTSPAEQSSAAWDRGGSCDRRRRQRRRRRRKRRGRRQ
jgi:hypothetical protein